MYLISHNYTRQTNQKHQSQNTTCHFTTIITLSIKNYLLGVSYSQNFSHQTANKVNRVRVWWRKLGDGDCHTLVDALMVRYFLLYQLIALLHENINWTCCWPYFLIILKYAMKQWRHIVNRCVQWKRKEKKKIYYSCLIKKLPREQSLELMRWR